ncbi:MAG: carboxypeptidase regulatory-like domain-containing protein [Planctomycetes bacterium]|nr:carboxypeptidase regulatory-like domain-containing protein [Planctomycetota bacterium]
MRALVVLLLLGVALAVYFTGFADGAGGPMPDPTPTPGPTGTSAPAMPTTGPGLPAGVEATRTRIESKAAEGVATTATACIRVVDNAANTPVLGAAVRRVKDGSELAFTDERGLASLPLPGAEQLAVVLDGYLLRLVPAQYGTDEKDPQEVRLVRDDWSPRRRFSFVGPGGAPLPEAFVRFRVTAPGSGAPPVPRDDAVLRRAWTEHVMLASRPVCSDVAVQLGAYDENRVHRLADGAEVRFVGAGEFTIEAATASGFVARAQVRIELRQEAAFRIDFVAGVFVAGTVSVLEGGGPAAGATVALAGGDPLGLLATADAAGRFQFGPLMPGPVTLHVLAPGMAPRAFGPLTAPATGLAIELQKLQQTLLRGHVRELPGGEPVVRATVVWAGAGGAHQVFTGADGAFVVPVDGKDPARLLIQADGFQARAEFVDPGAQAMDYGLWPADPARRLEKGLTGVLQGFVLDGNGRPLPNVNVRWRPVTRSAPAAVPGRRVLEGGTLALPLVAVSDAAGAFRLETDQFGPGQLLCGAAQNGLETQAIAGKVVDGLRLQP